MTASQAATAVAPEKEPVSAPDLTTPDAADLQKDTEEFRLDEAIEGLRNSSQEMRAKADAEQENHAARQAAVWNIAVDIQVVLGTMHLTVADLLAMKADASYPLENAGDTSLELVAGGHTIGWCELVAPARESDPLSIRITKLNAAGLPPVAQVG